MTYEDKFYTLIFINIYQRKTPTFLSLLRRLRVTVETLVIAIWRLDRGQKRVSKNAYFFL